MADMPNDFWSGWIVTLTVVSLAVLLWVVLSIYFSKKTEVTEEEEEPVWDGDLREGHNAPPLWWFWLILGCMVFSVGYLLLYPGLGSYSGALEWSQDSRVAASNEQFEERFREHREAIAASSLSELQADPTYMSAAEGIFSRNCAACHGPDAMGQAALFPNLRDAEWQWGGSTDAIEHSIRQGRQANMVSWQGVLSGADVDAVADYVLALGSEAASNHPGAGTYGQYCASCHGADGSGNEMLGAPDLSDDIWLYGGDKSTIKTSIVRGRQGEMPAFGERLDDTQVKLLVAWLTRQTTTDQVALED